MVDNLRSGLDNVRSRRDSVRSVTLASDSWSHIDQWSDGDWSGGRATLTGGNMARHGSPSDLARVTES
jgi:hypothetical protein